VQGIDSFASSLTAAVSGLQSATQSVQSASLDRMQRWQQRWQPLADRLDVV
jgi:hypothetical protein